MVDVLGADALVDDGRSPMVHSFLNARAETIYGGANEIQRNILGERSSACPKSPADQPARSRGASSLQTSWTCRATISSAMPPIEAPGTPFQPVRLR